MNYFANVGKTFPSMKHIILAAAFAVATLTACAHHPAPVTNAKVVKTCKSAK